MDTVSDPAACRRAHELLGPLALGHLREGEERAWLEEHLAGCPACTAEYQELRPVVALLPLVDPARLGQPPAAPPPLLGARILRTVSDEKGRARRRRLALTGLAASVVLVLAGALGAGLALRDDGTVERRLVAVGERPVTGQARLVEQPWGTRVTLELAGLSPGTSYGAWLERADGTRILAGTFRADGDRVVITLSAALPLPEGQAVGVSTLQGTDVLRADLTAPPSTPPVPGR